MTASRLVTTRCTHGTVRPPPRPAADVRKPAPIGGGDGAGFRCRLEGTRLAAFPDLTIGSRPPIRTGNFCFGMANLIAPATMRHELEHIPGATPA